MPDMKKLVNELNDCLESQHISFIDGVGDIYAVSEETIRDVIAFMKELEPMKPDSFMDGCVQRFACKKCGKHLFYSEWGRDNYCSKCGQEVKW